MILDPATLGLAFVLLMIVLGGLLVFSWTLNRKIHSLAWWGSAYCLVALGMSLVSLGQHSPSGLVLIIANGLVALAYGAQYTGCRVFNGRSLSIPALLAGPALWLLAWPILGGWFAARLALMTLIICGYMALSAWELWRHARFRLASQTLAIILLLGSIAFHFLRGLLGFLQTSVPWIDALAHRWSAEMALVLLLYVPVLAFAYLSMTRERTEEEYRRAVLLVQESETRFRDYAETAADWLWELDENLRFTRLHGRRADAFGRPLSEILGQSAEFLIQATAADKSSTDVLMRLQAREPIRDVESHIKGPDGSSRWFATSGRPLFDPSGQFTGYRGVSTDLTQHRRLEAQLRQAQKMEAVGQLTGGLAHDFNNLLGIIIGNLDFVSGQHHLDAEAGEALKEAVEAALRGAELNRRLLAFARRQPLQPKRLDVNNLVSTTAKLLERGLGENIELRLSLALNLGAVVVDPAQLESAITNLAVNARDAMPEGGRLTIATYNRRFDELSGPDHADANPGEYVLIEVTDSGCGIGPEHLNRVFEPFFTTKEVGKGTGLGLSQVQGFIDQSGGHVRIQSEKNLGTTVRLYLPQAAEESKTDATRPDARETPGAAAQEVVLAVEDNESLRRVLVKQLRELGYEVLQAETGEAALKILRTAPRVDLLLTDVVMPGGLNGYELARKAGLLCPDLKVLFTSGFPETALGPEAPLKPDEVLLGKPYRKDELAQKVRQALATQPTGT